MQRNISLDILKIILAFMVIGIHTSFFKEYSELIKFMLTDGFFRMAVPIFLIINGYFFFTISNIKIIDWIKRVFLLYTFWMFFYSYFWFRIDNFNIETLYSLLTTYLFGYGHLWYVIAMLFAGFCLQIIKNKSVLFLTFTIFSTFSFGVLIQYLINYDILEVNSVNLHRNFLFLAFPFFTIGFLIKKLNLDNLVSLYKLYILFFIGIFCLFLESYLNYYYLEKLKGFDNLFSLIIIAPVVFIIFLKFNFKGYSKQLSYYSSGIYFIHIFVLSLLSKLFNFQSIELSILTLVVSTLFTFLLIEANKKLKIIL